MNITKITTLFFSPTGTSKKIVQAIAEGAGQSCQIEHIDLTLPKHQKSRTFAGNELTIIAVPVYAGRVAQLAKERLQQFSGSNSPAIVVVIYGNREFEDALVELKDLAQAQSFSVVAASAFIGEHSFSSAETPIAQGRPDKNDLTIAKEFGQKAMQQLMASKTSADIKVPGDIPYKDGMKNLPFTPTVDTDECTQCEECISVCPTGAISLTDQININAELCIFCCACIKNCPVECISLKNTPMQEKAGALTINCKERKEPQLFY
jgi:ferredoxin/flavodoxin